mmetsp:Transcript_38720/g.86122  ORF Transcript_38720/g.86122 Transcript_38720/m.86122 type:complete len:103 (-) Transcript_38720:360-668(-)|eukprot:CAMPEP_0202889554 /NCGR_PEP_ID=MMETSP1392-20130828/144_1 /ASSEMBLY_ACC=CAM_ASM_000868 /TAXON_ID=225041 /ORGANISM="Chlamydomonas chlamydogama, Strain SAG 11-48b" /LENGTH=102 /DNA_ID=CAMNT_0049572909 /DNA_START=97 /DNA_END=405 /DNA_ORIENTATION=-
MAQPLPGIPVGAPPVPPQPGQVIVSYQVKEPEYGCCKCDDLTTGGLVLLIVGILFFFPIAFIPCCCEGFKNKKQYPVYGYPNQGGAVGVPIAPVAAGGYAPK